MSLKSACKPYFQALLCHQNHSENNLLSEAEASGKEQIITETQQKIPELVVLQ